MENHYIRKALISGVFAVATGVMVLGVNAAFGAESEPTNPPGSAVTPTFSGINLNGGELQDIAPLSPLTVGDSLRVENSLQVLQNTVLSGELSVLNGISNPASAISQELEAVQIDDDLYVTGELLVKNGNGLASTDQPLYLNKNSTLPVYVGSGASGSDLVVNGDSYTFGRIVATGGIGTTTRIDGSDITLATNSTSSRSRLVVGACPAGQLVVSCGYQARYTDRSLGSTAEGHYYGPGLSQNSETTNGNTCTMSFYNDSANSLDVRPITTCFDPAS